MQHVIFGFSCCFAPEGRFYGQDCKAKSNEIGNDQDGSANPGVWNISYILGKDCNPNSDHYRRYDQDDPGFTISITYLPDIMSRCFAQQGVCADRSITNVPGFF